MTGFEITMIFSSIVMVLLIGWLVRKNDTLHEQLRMLRKPTKCDCKREPQLSDTDNLKDLLGPTSL